MKIHHILCPVDFSEASNHAVDHAVALARHYDARLRVLHVYPSVGRPPTLPVPDSGGAYAPTADEVEALIERAASLVPADSGVTVHAAAIPGTPVSGIIEEASAWPADLIVMGTHGTSGFQHLILGSVTEKVLRRAPCPVLTVPPRAQATSRQPFTRVVCAVDFSDGSQKAVAFAASLAKEGSASLTLLHVIEWPWFEPANDLTGLPPEQAVALTEYRRYLESGAVDRLVSLASEAAPEGPAPATEVRFGKPYTELLDAARERQADVIVMGVRGRSALDIGFFGSTTNQVVRHATCPVLTVKG